MKQKFRIVLVSMLLVVGMLVAAGASSYDHCADQLKALGLFQGTEQGYELDRAPTRAEAATMLVRLLGKEADAQSWSIPLRLPIWKTGKSPMFSICMITN